MTSMRQRRRIAAFEVNRQRVASNEDWSQPSDWKIAVMQIALIRGPVSISILQRRLRLGYSKAVGLRQALCNSAIISMETPYMGMVKHIVSDKYVEYWLCQPHDRARFVQAIDDECYDLARACARRLGRVPRLTTSHLNTSQLSTF